MTEKNVQYDTLSKSKTVKEVHEAFMRLNAALHTFSSAVSADTKLTLSEIVAAEHLRLDGPLTPKELSRRVRMGSGGTTAIIDRLEGRGFAERVKHPTDRRSVLVRAVEQGGDTLQQPLALQEAVYARLGELSDDERRAVLRFLGGVADDVMRAVAGEAGTKAHS